MVLQLLIETNLSTFKKAIPGLYLLCCTPNDHLFCSYGLSQRCVSTHVQGPFRLAGSSHSVACSV